jgi:glucose/arabinose dehydrogenase
MKRLSLPAILVTAVALLAGPASASAASAQPLSPSPLDYPAAFTPTPDGGSIFYAELNTGEVRRLNPSTGVSTPFFTIPDVTSAGDQGLLGLALHPSYPSNRNVWAFVTRIVSGTATNQLIRIRPDGSGFAVVHSFPTATSRDGGRIAFGPDGKLYATVGDNTKPSLSQSLASEAGKVMRMNPDGTVPANNPSPGSRVIAYGFRNSFGFTFDPQSGRLWATDNGPHCNDEINLVPRLRLTNFGWGPSQTCATPPPAPRNTNRDGPNPVLPRVFFADPTALTGAAFCDGCGLSSPGQLFIGEFVTGTIRRATLTPDRLDIASQAPYYHDPGSILAVEAPLHGGPIYFSTRTNIYRLAP